MTRSARLLHRAVRVYQRLFAGRPSPCRFVPSCSNYALDALESHGARRGGWLLTRRLLRCHPWGGQGWDPVPGARPPDLAGGRSGPGPTATETMERRCSI